jgi:hypothetical protein
MPTIHPTLPNDGEDADAGDVNVPFEAILALLNGQLDSDNILSLDGSKLLPGTVTDAAINTAAQSGWINSGDTLVYVTNNGNKEYSAKITGDKTGKYSPGMRVRMGRSTAAPIRCIDPEASSSQYASRNSPTGFVFTDDFTCEGWVKLESYGAERTIVSRYDGTNGFIMSLTAAGQIRIVAIGAKDAISSRSVPLNQWVHIAATLDCSSSVATLYMNGVACDYSISGGGSSFIQAGEVQVGAYNSGQFFDGKLVDVRVWSAVRSQNQIRDNMNIQLVGNEANLIGYWKLTEASGTLFADSTSNANSLTAQGGLLSGTLDNPMKSLEYGIILSVNYSAPDTTLVIYAGLGNNIPNMTLTNFYYSTQHVPFLFPYSLAQMGVKHTYLYNTAQSTSSTSIVAFSSGAFTVTPPDGCQYARFRINAALVSAGGNTVVMFVFENSTAGTQIVQSNVNSSNMSYEFDIPVISSVAKTFVFAWSVTGGTGVFDCSVASPGQLSVEFV